MLRGFFRSGGAPWIERIASLGQILGGVFAMQSQTARQSDPLRRTRQVLAEKDADRLAALESAVRREIQKCVAMALSSQGRAL